MIKILIYWKIYGAWMKEYKDITNIKKGAERTAPFYGAPDGHMFFVSVINPLHHQTQVR